MTRRALAALWIVATALACARGAERGGPPEIEWGERECDRCRMILSSPRYAGAARFADGRVAVFDDVACLADFVARAAQPPAEVWVHDGETGDWIEARAARFERRPELVTPMGSGLVALRAAAAEGAEGSYLTFDELIEEIEP